VRIKNVRDNEDRRIGIDRRKFSYTKQIPNGRTQEERRSGLERRSDTDRRVVFSTNLAI